MPLQVFWEAHYLDDHRWKDGPPFILALRGVVFVSWLVILFFSLWQLIHERLRLFRSRNVQIAPSKQQHFMRQIVLVPFFLGTCSALSLFFPSNAYGLELVISIGTAIQVTAVTHQSLEAFAEPPLTEAVVRRLPAKRWWCGAKCGGFSDPMPYLAFCFGQARQAKKISVSQLTLAYYFVHGWAFVSITSAIYFLYWNAYPKTMIQEGAWCRGIPEMPKAQGLFLLFLGLWASVFGLSGFGVLSGASTLAVSKANDGLDIRKHKKRGNLAQLYVSIPLLKAILQMLPIHFEDPARELFSPINGTFVVRNSTGAIVDFTKEQPGLLTAVHTEVGWRISCPIFDDEVVNILMYACLVTVIMALHAFRNWRLNPVEEWNRVLLPPSPEVLAAEASDSEGNEQSDSGSSSSAVSV